MQAGRRFQNFYRTLGFILYCERNTVYILKYLNGIRYKKSFYLIYLINFFAIHKCVASIIKTQTIICTSQNNNLFKKSI